MKFFASLVLAGAFALALSACSVTTAVNDINSLTGALSSPAANQAAANLKAGAQAVACTVADVDIVAQEIELNVTVPKAYAVAIKRDTTSIYVVSTAACAFFGGTAIGTQTVPASAPAPIVPVASVSPPVVAPAKAS